MRPRHQHFNLRLTPPPKNSALRAKDSGQQSFCLFFSSPPSLNSRIACLTFLKAVSFRGEANHMLLFLPLDKQKQPLEVRQFLWHTSLISLFGLMIFFGVSEAAGPRGAWQLTMRNSAVPNLFLSPHGSKQSCPPFLLPRLFFPLSLAVVPFLQNP